MASDGRFAGFISLALRRFGREKNLSGDYKSVEAAAIPTVTMVAEWARDKRDDVSEIWVFGSSVDNDSWDSLADDLDLLLVVPDEKWGHDSERSIMREVPLSDQYLKLDVRVRRESDCEPWRTKALTKSPVEPPEEGRRMTVAEYAMREGVCLWRREDEKPKDGKDSTEGAE